MEQVTEVNCTQALPSGEISFVEIPGAQVCPDIETQLRGCRLQGIGQERGVHRRASETDRPHPGATGRPCAIEAAAPEAVLPRIARDREGELLRGAPLTAERVEDERLERADGAFEDQPVHELRPAEPALDRTEDVNRHVVFEYQG